MSGETNRLIGLAEEIQSRPVASEYDTLVSTGEQVTIALLSMALQELNALHKAHRLAVGYAHRPLTR